MHDRPGTLYGSVGTWKVDYFRYHDGFLCFALPCLAAAVSRYRKKDSECSSVWPGGCTDSPVYDATESMAQCGRKYCLGNLSEPSIYDAGAFDYPAVLWQRQVL